MRNSCRPDRFATWLAVLATAAFAAVAAAQGPAPATPRPNSAPGTPRAAGTPSAPSPARSGVSLEGIVPLDRVIAVVNDEALTQYDIAEQKRVVLNQMKSQNVTPPAADVLEKQLLDRLITERVLLQFAKDTGIRVDDTTIERTLARIAQDNKLSPEEFRKAVEREGIPFAKYREDMRSEIVIQRLRDREVDSRLSVSDAEVDHFLATLDAQSGGDVEYLLSHILVSVPEQASPVQIDARLRRAEEALRQLRSGAEFGQVAAGFSDAPDALQGGSLGWRAAARLPTVFADPVRSLKPGEISSVLRSASGFHIVKLQDTRSRNAPTVVEQTHVRHILVKINEITSEAEAKAKIERIKERIDLGATFEEQAKLNSEDASAAKGGDLGWVSPGDTVPDFEQTMNRLKLGELSAPVHTQFGWHVIQVMERRTQDVTAERKRDQARMSLRQRKSDEAFQDWVRQLRDRAYIEIKVDDR